MFWWCVCKTGHPNVYVSSNGCAWLRKGCAGLFVCLWNIYNIEKYDNLTDISFTDKVGDNKLGNNDND
jgi:hypothetical protein